jgi:hypothetical protein
MNPRNFDENTDDNQRLSAARRGVRLGHVGHSRRLAPASSKPPAFPLFGSIPDLNPNHRRAQVSPHNSTPYRLSVSMDFKNRGRWDSPNVFLRDGSLGLGANSVTQPPQSRQVQTSSSSSEHSHRWRSVRSESCSKGREGVSGQWVNYYNPAGRAT